MGKIALAGVLTLALVASGAPAALGADPAVGIGEVTAGAAATEVDDAALRAMVEAAVGRLDPAKLPRGRAAVLSVSLVRLESRSAPDEVSCLVSATLRDRARGAVFAVLEGSARGQDEPRRRRALQRAIVRAAVTSAVARVPEALARGPWQAR